MYELLNPILQPKNVENQTSLNKFEKDIIEGPKTITYKKNNGNITFTNGAGVYFKKQAHK